VRTVISSLTNKALEAQRFEAWYVAYALLGVVSNGLVPILLPLSTRHGIDSGLVYGSFSLTGLAAPMLGGWSDRRQGHRTLLIGGLALAAFGIFLFPLIHGLAAHMAAAATAGLGTIAASTVGTMFILQTAPKPEWDERIGSLQGWISTGQIAGLLIAGMLATRPTIAFEGAAACLLCGVWIAWRYAPASGEAVPRAAVVRQPPVGGEAGITHHQFHRISLHGLRTLVRLPCGDLARFLGVWLLSLSATYAVTVMLPVAMTREYGTTALLPSAAYAAGIALSLPLYPLSGRWEARSSGYRVMLAGLRGRIALLALLAIFGFIHDNWHGDWVIGPILAGFAVTQIIWPLLSVSSNSLAVVLDPVSRGEGVGLLNATSSVAATIGGVLGGLLIQKAGYAALCAVACVAVALAAAMIGRRNFVPNQTEVK
jgi:DHA1 family tetracycline resistance protein-like MFS transporter